MATPSMPNLPKISLTRNQIIMIGGGLLLVIVVIVLVLVSGKNSSATPVALKVWGTDPAAAFQPLIDWYAPLHPNVTVEYTQIPRNGYYDTLLTAMAARTGPDVFMIGNHDLLSRGQVLVAAPETLVSAATVRDSFPQAVVQDFTYDGTVFALPLYMDTLRLVYNKPLLDQAGIAVPPATWEELLSAIPKLRVLDEQGQVERAAIAIGGTESSIEHATDILNLLMFQNGATLADDKAAPVFGNNPAALQALLFYLQFADANSPSYTWSDALGNSLESFAAQKTAMAFVYQEDVAEIRAKAPFLEMEVIPVPQVSAAQTVNYPKYQGLAVWPGSRAPSWAWDFVRFAATDPSAQKAYLAQSGHPAALRTLIAAQEDKSALTARSWKMGDYDKIKEIFSSVIQNVQTGAKTPSAALKDAEAQARQLLQ